MLQNTLDEVAGCPSGKQMSDQVVARGYAPHFFDAYIELRLTAYSTNDKWHASPRSGLRNVYSRSNANHIATDESYDAHEYVIHGIASNQEALIMTGSLCFQERNG
jgi:hypothetical protein